MPTDNKVLVSDESITLGLSNDKFLGTIFGDVDVITHRLNVGIELGSLDGSFGDSTDGKLGGLLLLESLGYAYGNVLGVILKNVDRITLGLDFENRWYL